MKKPTRRVRLIVIAVLIATAAPFIWAVGEYARFRKFGSYTLALPPVAAFSDAYSYAPGDQVRLHVHSGEDVRGTLFRLGETKEQIGGDFIVHGQPQSNRYDLVSGLQWDQTDVLEIDGLRPGLYSLELTSSVKAGESFILPFVLRSSGAQIGVILSTNTWDAYNAFGGVSNYQNDYLGPISQRLIAEVKWWGGQFQDIHLPSGRPNIAVSDDLQDESDPSHPYYSRLVRHEWTFLAFLESEGYEYALYTDRDLAFGSEWETAKLLAFPGHSEYWSPEMHFAFERFVDAGGRILMSAGNPMLKPVTYTDTGLSFHQTVNDPWIINDLVGTSFTGAGIFTAAPFQVVRADHWVFADTGANTGDVFGRQSATQLTEAFDKREGRPPVDGASGVFTLKPGRGSGEFEVIAIGLNEVGPAYMVYKDTVLSGWIFNSSSGAFTGSLHSDEVSRQIVRNLLNNALSSHP